MTVGSNFLNRKVFACLVMLALAWSVFAEDGALPGGYGSVVLGMSVDSAKNALKEDPAYGYRGDRDVSLLPGEDRVLISTAGVLFFW